MGSGSAQMIPHRAPRGPSSGVAPALPPHGNRHFDSRKTDTFGWFHGVHFERLIARNTVVLSMHRVTLASASTRAASKGHHHEGIEATTI
jgi:hypothetical protein